MRTNITTRQSPKYFWIGAVCSVVFLLYFLFLKAEGNAAITLEPQWLLFALVPVGLGLFLGGYVKGKRSQSRFVFVGTAIMAATRRQMTWLRFTPIP